ncbi:MAG: hypothetical protein ABIJ09_14540 [Pseudomonadota bacterium]
MHGILKTVLILLIALLGAAVALAAGAGAPARGLPYRGHLEFNGAPLSSTVAMEFRLYDDATAGTELFMQVEDDVTVTGGAFAVVLGTKSTNLLPETVYTSRELFLAITVNGVPLAGRQQIFASTQSVRAAQADGFAVTAGIHGGNSGGNLHVDANNPAGGDGQIYLNWFSGNGVVFGNAAQGQVARVDTAGNLSTAGTVTTPAINLGDLKLRLNSGGGSHIAGSNVNGNLHIDADNPSRGVGKLYLNLYSGKGVVVGNGAGGTVTSVDTAGNISTKGLITSHSDQTTRCGFATDQCGGDFNAVCPSGQYVAGVRNWAGNCWQVTCCWLGAR